MLYLQYHQPNNIGAVSRQQSVTKVVVFIFFFIPKDMKVMQRSRLAFYVQVTLNEDES